MQQQNYTNHIRFYYTHHFLFYPLLLVFIGFCMWCYYNYPGHEVEFACLAALGVLVGWLSFMLRQHYSLTLQDRIICLEMRFRYYLLTGKTFENIEKRLTFKQVAALRFAGDEELVQLTELTIKNNLTADDIKVSIKHWRPDQNRV